MVQVQAAMLGAGRSGICPVLAFYFERRGRGRREKNIQPTTTGMDCKDFLD